MTPKRATKVRYKYVHPCASLTEAGWPRPVVDTNIGRLPVPWSAPPNQLGVNDEERSKLASRGETCQLCGLPHKKGQRAYAFVKDKNKRYKNGISFLSQKQKRGKTLKAMDKAVLHRRCAKLALTFCPILREMKERGILHVFSVPTFSGYEIEGDKVKWVTNRF